MDTPCCESKVWCCKEQYCIGAWSVKSMNQGMLDAVKQEMARVNTDILEISELKWTGIGKCNLDGDYVYYCGQESLRRNGIAFRVNKRNAVLGCNLKNYRMILVHFQGSRFSSTLTTFPHFYIIFLLIIYPLLQLFVCPGTKFSLLNTIAD